MKPLLKPIALNETSNNVVLLHQVLAVLGFPVAGEEVEQHTAGPNTLEKVRALQAQSGVDVDESTLVDDATIAAIASALEEGGLTDESKLFTVAGTVRLPDGTVKKQQDLLVYDVDLRGIAIYRTAETSAEIDSNGGFQFLGEATSDNQGVYTLSFYDFQYQQAERKYADVVVYAVEAGQASESGEGGEIVNQIIGHSRLVQSEDYSEARIVEGLDVPVIQTDNRSEYVKLMSLINPFLMESGLSLLEIATSQDQLSFVATELDVDLAHVKIAASAELFRQVSVSTLPHQMVYGLGRQNILLDWVVIFRKTQAELRAAIVASMKDNIIDTFAESVVTAFLQALQTNSVHETLHDTRISDDNSLSAMLLNAGLDEPQSLAFLSAVNTFTGSDFSVFWNTHLPSFPAFANNPQLISDLLLNQGLTWMSGNHQPLVHQLQVVQNIDSMKDLVVLKHSDWVNVVRQAGVPPSPYWGDDAEDAVRAYAEFLQGVVSAAFPTPRISQMVEDNELHIESNEVSTAIATFLSSTPQFDFATSRVHDFTAEIEAAAPQIFEEVRAEMLTLQRVFQVSTSPSAMGVLRQENLDSAYRISTIPRNSFISRYGDLFAEGEASSIYNRARYIAGRTEHSVANIWDYAFAVNPTTVVYDPEQQDIAAVLESHIPNYSTLFGSPDICECEQCRSVYSAAAYFVDLLKFLSSSIPNQDMPTKSPLKILTSRRPDLLNLHLTCENTNTVIPYIDLANEVMECYTANGSLSTLQFDTGEATAEELRANPQNVNIQAYSELSTAKYPFTLPFHQPLDVIRTYSGHLGVSRYEAMKAINPIIPDPDPLLVAASIAMESLRISPEEYAILILTETMDVYLYYGYTSIAQLDRLSFVLEFLKRSGVAYTDLIELVKTQFINPYQDTLDFLQEIFSGVAISGNTLYSELKRVATSPPPVFIGPVIMDALDAYNLNNDPDISIEDFVDWLRHHFGDFQRVITLFEPDSKCDLDNTRLRTIKSIYEEDPAPPPPPSGITKDSWSRFHRFIRLWRRLGWTIHETDLMLTALGDGNITPATIGKLESVSLLKTATKLPVNQLTVLWGNIDTYGDKSLYKKLFLSKTVSQIDEVFKPDAFGRVLQDPPVGPTVKLGDHLPAIFAAFRMNQEDLDAIIEVAMVSEGDVERTIDIATDTLNLPNLSTIYRYVLLAKALKLRVTELCKLITLFDAKPFSIWNMDNETFISINPDQTLEFYELAGSVRKAGFKSDALEYIFKGTLPAKSTIGLSKDKLLTTAKSIRDAFAAIDLTHPDVPPSPLTPEIITAKLSLTFRPEIVSRFLQILDGTATFETFTDQNLEIAFPGSSLFSASNFSDLNGLVLQFRTHADDVSSYLWDRFSGVTQQVLTNLTSTTLQQKRVLVDELNIILIGESIYEAQRFAEVTLSTDTVTLLGENPQGADLIRLNRMLLEEAYPQKIAKIPVSVTLSNKYTYVKTSGRLVCAGIMTETEKAILKTLANTTDNFRNAVDDLYNAPEIFINTYFSDILGHLATEIEQTNAVLLDHPEQDTAATLENKLAFVYSHFIPIIKSKLRGDAMTEHIAALIGLTGEVTSVLIAGDLERLISDLARAGFAGNYFRNDHWTTPPPSLTRVDTTIDFEWGTGSPDVYIPSDHFSARWEAFISPTTSGQYTLVVDVDEADDVFNLYLDDALILNKVATTVPASLEVTVTLNSAQAYLLKLDYAETTGNAGIRLRWRTATMGLVVVPSAVAYPPTLYNDFVKLATFYHRAAKFVSGFKLNETELNHLITFASDFGNINFKDLDAGDWKRIYDYVTLRGAVPQARALLTDVFALANSISPAPTVNDLRALLYLATAWDAVGLEYLVNVHFHLGVNDFKNEIALNRLRDVLEIVAKSGISAQIIAAWGNAETEFNALHETALLLRSAVKAKYEEKDWLDIAASLNDTIREDQKQALIAYLLTRQAIQAWGAEDADGLFEYFLIDVQMGACMDTSRIVQANSSVQMFVNRCLINLESKTSNDAEMGVSPKAIDRDRWEWMKNYRVWEANRKVFLYPENWLEPEWRKDRSDFFKDLESYLVQNDITDRNVEQAFRDYLASLNEVANLEVCGTHRENYEDGSFRYLHVFARTHQSPYKFFHRRWNEFGKWSPWKKVPIDIRTVDHGDESGVHTIPIFWKQRFFLFVPEFTEVAVKRDLGTTKIKDLANEAPATIEPTKHWEIRLAWSEYVDEKWSPKQLSKEFIVVLNEYLTPANGLSVRETRTASNIRWVYEIDPKVESLQIVAHFKLKDIRNNIHWHELGMFHLSDISSRVEILEQAFTLMKNDWSGYELSFMNFVSSATGKLLLKNVTYLDANISHKLLVTPTRADYVPLPEDPFFYSDAKRTYFVRYIDINYFLLVTHPENSPPFLPLGSDNDESQQISQAQTLLLSTGSEVNAEPSDNTVPILQGSDDVSTAIAPTQSRYPSPELSRTYGSFDSGTQAIQSADTIRNMLRNEKGLQFHTFYHPFSGTFVKNLNQKGIPCLLESDTVIDSDNGLTFETTYRPRFGYGYVQKPNNFATRTYYKENVCFDVYGANSQYNWELFFHAPLYIATRLSKNGRYAEAMKWFHYIFDPTTDEVPGEGQSEVSRYWKVLPFKTTTATKLEDLFRSLSDRSRSNPLKLIIGEWRDNPFDPHLIAANRPLAYMKNVVMKYVENLIAWGDSLFRQFTMETVNEALQIYVIANHILGPRPQFVPKRGTFKAETYSSLETKWDEFSNALVELENIFPYSSEVSVSGSTNGTSLLGAGSALYFCIPTNEKLLELWDTAADRLFKIRHCQDIDGVERHLALFSPPIDPGALIQAASQGLSLGSILADLSSPPPIYRFSFLIQKANEFCGDVKALGSALLSALASRDAEELGNLRATQEVQMQELMTAIKERQVLDAKASRENLIEARETAAFRLQHYIDLLGNATITVPATPSISAELTADSQLPADTNIATIIPDVDQSLQDSAEAGVKLIPRELAELNKTKQAMTFQVIASSMEGIAGILNLIPNIKAAAEPFGVGVAVEAGGSGLGASVSALAKIPQIVSSILNFEATQAAKMASYIRREQDWTLQANLAAREIIQLDKQITSADIKVQISQKELENHKQQIENSKDVERFLREKFTNQELYQWMKEQLFAVYKQSYNLAFDMAKKAEKAYKLEMGSELASFIKYGYWDNSKQGLVAGDKLQLALRQLEKSYLEENRRELELSKSISLARLDPLALIALRETGRCEVTVPEEWFDLDFRGHYFRRLKAARLTIPCVVGPYSSVSCTLRLLNNSVRINTEPGSDMTHPYAHDNDAGAPIDDDRFRTNLTPVVAIATSLAQNDSGMFEFNFRDERYLPFERAGAISKWQIELSEESDLRQFDYSTISDVILHLDYTAREGAGDFKTAATNHMREFLSPDAEDPAPLMQMFDMRHEYPTEWHRFLNPPVADGEHLLNFTLGPDRFPFFTQEWNVTVMEVVVLARCRGTGSFAATLAYNNGDDSCTKSTFKIEKTYDELRVASFDTTEPFVNLAEQMTVTIDTSEMEDLYLVIRYRLAVPPSP